MADPKGNAIWSVDEEGGAEVFMALPQVLDPRSVAVDPDNNFLFWTSGSRGQSVHRATWNPDDTIPTPGNVATIAIFSNWTSALALDVRRQLVFVGLGSRGGIIQMSYDGSGQRKLVDEAHSVSLGIAVDPTTQ